MMVVLRGIYNHDMSSSSPKKEDAEKYEVIPVYHYFRSIFYCSIFFWGSYGVKSPSVGRPGLVPKHRGNSTMGSSRMRRWHSTLWMFGIGKIYIFQYV